MQGLTRTLHDTIDYIRERKMFGQTVLDGSIVDPRDTRNVLGFSPSICKDGNARTVRPVQFGVARP